MLSRKGKEGRKKNIFGPPENRFGHKKERQDVVACNLPTAFFFFPNALLGAAI